VSSERNPSLAAVIRVGIDRRLADIRTAVVGVVESYAEGKADVQILRPDPVENQDGTLSYLRGPVVRNVPIAMPGVSTKRMRITLPVSAGDFVTLVFSDRELSQWLQTGREVEPESPRTFDVSDAIAFLGPQPFTQSWTDDADVITIGSDSGAEEFVATAQRVLTELNKLKSAFDGHTHVAGALVAPSGGGPVTGATAGAAASPSLSAPASQTVKVKG
jgi:hypothetical protein